MEYLASKFHIKTTGRVAVFHDVLGITQGLDFTSVDQALIVESKISYEYSGRRGSGPPRLPAPLAPRDRRQPGVAHLQSLPTGDKAGGENWLLLDW